MLFNSWTFAIFFPVVVASYYAMPHRFRWALLLAASYYFYMCWKAEYLILILLSTAIDYYAGLQMGRSESGRKRTFFLLLSLAVNLGLLFSFKYFNFVNESLRVLLNQFNLFYGVPSFNALLPVGISFYTFQTLSYSIDVYRRQREPERHPGIFALYVAFFPQLVAGPIERSNQLLPQFRERHSFDEGRVTDGLKLMLWGFFKKLVIADRLAIYVNEVYNAPGEHHGLSILIATYFFAFQIFCDFSGYTDIARGAAQVMGFRLMLNFNRPYFAKSIAEFWKRWHISLSTWFRDYLYIPLGGNRVPKSRWYANLFIVFVVSGLWHGANWTFVVWGALHGVYLITSIWTAGLRGWLWKRTGLGRMGFVTKAWRVFVTFHLVCFSWIFFRANSIEDALVLLMNLLDFGAADALKVNVALGWYELAIAAGSIVFMECVHLLQRGRSLRATVSRAPVWIRWPIYYAVILTIAVLGVFNETQFIYFQF